MRLPSASAAAHTQLVVTPTPFGEEWLRSFDGRVLRTTQYALSDHDLAERFGNLEFRFHREVTPGNVVYRQRDVAFIVGTRRLRIPERWAPRIAACEHRSGGGGREVSVSVTLPVVGLLISYDGRVEIEDQTA